MGPTIYPFFIRDDYGTQWRLEISLFVETERFHFTGKIETLSEEPIVSISATPVSRCIGSPKRTTVSAAV